MTGRSESSAELQELVDAYLRHASERREEDFWAFDRVGEVVRGPDPERAFELVEALVRAAPDDRLGYIGAGPVEDLVEQHSAVLIDWIEGAARRDPRFREALASIWLVVEDVSSDALARLQAVTGNRILVTTQAELDAIPLPWEPEDRDRDA